MNQKSRQAASRKVEKDFYKLLNNRNFGIDCRNNINNCYLEPIYNDIDEVLYVNRPIFFRMKIIGNSLHLIC